MGSFHSGVRDLFDRLLDAAPDAIFVPSARRDGAYPYYFSETHMWERMLWRGCDFGNCPRRRGAGAEPLRLGTELGELRTLIARAEKEARPFPALRGRGAAGCCGALPIPAGPTLSDYSQVNF